MKRKPLVLGDDGFEEQLQAGDSLDTDIDGININAVISEELTDTIYAGMPVYISSSGKIKKAVNTAFATAKVCGLCYSSTIAAGDDGVIQGLGQMTLDSWINVTGTIQLTAGAHYFLDSTSGKLTTTAPTTTGCVTIVGIALTVDTLDIIIEKPILL